MNVDWCWIVETMEKIGRERNAPVYEMSLNDPFMVLVSAILSTRTKDEQTHRAVRRLFSVVKKPEDLLKLSENEIDELIKPVGFHRTKAKNLKKLAEVLVKDYHGKVPDSLKELLKLPGVGRKVANIVLAHLGKPAISVDTHVHRIANRLGVVKTKKPEETEEELKKIVPKELWSRLNKAFVGFGQTVCKPLKPLCEECPFKSFCEYFKNLRRS